jgi:hypothetical protein
MVMVIVPVFEIRSCEDRSDAEGEDAERADESYGAEDF